jgi:hypothetical protein
MAQNDLIGEPQRFLSAPPIEVLSDEDILISAYESTWNEFWEWEQASNSQVLAGFSSHVRLNQHPEIGTYLLAWEPAKRHHKADVQSTASDAKSYEACSPGLYNIIVQRTDEAEFIPYSDENFHHQRYLNLFHRLAWTQPESWETPRDPNGKFHVC